MSEMVREIAREIRRQRQGGGTKIGAAHIQRLRDNVRVANKTYRDLGGLANQFRRMGMQKTALSLAKGLKKLLPVLRDLDAALKAAEEERETAEERG